MYEKQSEAYQILIFLSLCKIKLILVFDFQLVEKRNSALQKKHLHMPIATSNKSNIHVADTAIIVNLSMTFCSYESRFGDGMYPDPTCLEGDARATFGFQVDTNQHTHRSWHQVSGPIIDHIDTGNKKYELIERLNLAYNHMYDDHERRERGLYTKMAMNRIHSSDEGATIMIAPINCLPAHEFVYRVVNHFKSTATWSLAEEILSYVGGKGRTDMLSSLTTPVPPMPRRPPPKWVMSQCGRNFLVG